MAYTIMINEEQRKALIVALSAAGVGDNSEQPLQYWVDMLTDLPEIDQGQVFECSPGEKRQMLHGFCL
jgi:hypothetical protein